MDFPMGLFQRRIDELLAIQSIFGPDIWVRASPEDLFAFLLTGSSDASSVLQFCTQPIVLSLQVGTVAVGAAVPAAGGGEPAAVVHVTLPPGYPSKCCSCSVSSLLLPKEWQTAAGGCLQALAAHAAAEGRECLFDLLQAAQEQASEALQALLPAAGAPTGSAAQAAQQQHHSQQLGEAPNVAGGGNEGNAHERGRLPGDGGVRLEQQHGAAAGGEGGAEAPTIAQQAGRGGVGCKGAQAPVRLVLLRLDHMHDRRRYCRTVRRWCGELGLTGRLLFLGQLILVLLEGAAADVKESLARWRTQSVDVDSKGRPCKERMMDILAEDSRPHRCFDTFEEVDLHSFEQLRQVLERAGASQWLPMAAGFDPSAGGRNSRLKG